MDGLRWLLLLFGLLVIAGVYFYSRREKSTPEAEPMPSERVEPTLGDDESPAEPDASNARADTPVAEVPDEQEASAAPESVPQKIVTLRLVARDGGAFRGDELVLSLRGIGMRHGKFGIFHRYDGSNEDETIFSAASLVEPGSFDLTNIKEQELPGISLFLILPGPIEGAEAFDMMMSAARAVAQALDGELLDESGSTLSIQRERYMREEVIQFEHSIKVA
ncbi:MAG: cell division protein ZipA [Gammaproteobacteria bacterium]|nr:cell division protein ZipA [Gammaproteobacteria bacterium]